MSDDLTTRLRHGRPAVWTQLAEEAAERIDDLEFQKAAWMGRQDGTADVVRQLEDRAESAERECERLREAAVDTTASLVAAISLLERGGRRAAPSDKMFAQMLADYRNSVERAREVLKTKEED